MIDDFGRQRMRIEELLNRWIVPLERRYDFLNMPNGKKIEVPFDQLIIFATNLEPRDLVDEAFLRRIPYKIEVLDPEPRGFQGALPLAGQADGLSRSAGGGRVSDRRRTTCRRTGPSAIAIPATSSCRSATTAAIRIARWRSPTSTSTWRWKTISR